MVNGKSLSFIAKGLGEILGIPLEGIDVYVRRTKLYVGQHDC